MAFKIMQFPVETGDPKGIWFAHQPIEGAFDVTDYSSRALRTFYVAHTSLLTVEAHWLVSNGPGRYPKPVTCLAPDELEAIMSAKDNVEAVLYWGEQSHPIQYVNELGCRRVMIIKNVAQAACGHAYN